MPEGLERRTEALSRYLAELSQRMATPEVHDLAALTRLAGSLQRALVAVTPQEIGWAVEKADALIGELEALQGQLTTLAALKRTFSGDGDCSR